MVAYPALPQVDMGDLRMRVNKIIDVALKQNAMRDESGELVRDDIMSAFESAWRWKPRSPHVDMLDLCRLRAAASTAIVILAKGGVNSLLAAAQLADVARDIVISRASEYHREPEPASEPQPEARSQLLTPTSTRIPLQPLALVIPRLIAQPLPTPSPSATPSPKLRRRARWPPACYAHLSKELLVNIFLRLPPQDIVRVSHVCATWRGVMLERRNASLWTTVDGVRPVAIPAFLERSGALPVSLVIDFKTHRPRDEEYTTVFRAVKQAMPRVRSLDVRIHKDDRDVFEGLRLTVLARRAPILESFRLDYTPSCPSSRLSSNVFDSRAGALRSASFAPQVYPRHKCAALRKVRTYDTVTDDYTAGHLRVILKDCLRIVELRLGRPLRDTKDEERDVDKIWDMYDGTRAGQTLERLDLACDDGRAIPTLKAFNHLRIRHLRLRSPSLDACRFVVEQQEVEALTFDEEKRSIILEDADGRTCELVDVEECDELLQLVSADVKRLTIPASIEHDFLEHSFPEVHELTIVLRAGRPQDLLHDPLLMWTLPSLRVMHVTSSGGEGVPSVDKKAVYDFAGKVIFPGYGVDQIFNRVVFKDVFVG
ncbi:hypothetical protein EXIGLDRAFT_843117 [Exidia glandulosa HHB12029]|uniref:F-box domain-containing protein n=1 Tax=Exidia glandulosa HHB12029 TaxID=1314781 RepID=A0A165CVS2_EXIGL|nr:hypothetical protein EXIGLDRAFT_843117 [Exidia glandulosa HHB12029]